MTASRSVDESVVAGCRKRPGMYVGNVDSWGFVNYLVGAFRLLLERGATRILFDISSDELRFASDAKISTAEVADTTNIFEGHFDSNDKGGFDTLVLNALSERLRVRADGNAFEYQRGERVESTLAKSPSVEGVVIDVIPDSSIFTNTSIDAFFLECFLKRSASLFPKVEFVFKTPQNETTFYSERGILDIFEGAVSPYQLMHRPIHLSGTEGTLEIDFAFAFHSWFEEQTWSYVNNGRAEGGSHVKGFQSAFGKFLKPFSLSNYFPGKLAMISVKSPHAQWVGCIKSEVASDELEKEVADLTLKLLNDWAEANPVTYESIGKFAGYSHRIDW